MPPSEITRPAMPGAAPAVPAAPSPPAREQEPTDPIFSLGLITFVLVLVAWGVLFVIGSMHQSQINSLDQKIQKNNQEISKLQSTLDTYNALDLVTSQVKTLRDNRYVFTPTWDMLKDSVPKDVQFLTLSLGTDKTFRIAGVTKSVTSVAQFAKELETKTDISMVTPLSVEKQSNNNIFNFTLTFKIGKASQANGGAQ